MPIMDLERIKQNLRLRSGRSRKDRQRQRQSQQPPQQQHQPPPPTKQQPQLTRSATRDQHSQTEKTKASKDPIIGSKDVSSQQEVEPELEKLPVPATSDTVVPSVPTNGDAEAEPEDSSDQPATMEQQQAYDSDDGQDFDLKPPPPKPKPASLETTSELLFSAGHLNSILHDQQAIARFTAFLNKYKPEYQPLILRYLETQKAIKAVEYANAVAASATTVDADTKEVQRSLPDAAAKLDSIFEDASKAAFKALVGTALPMYISYSLIKVVSQCLVDEITGKQSAIMQNLVGGLSEVFCITDPKQEDNPIIYASEEFYRYTGYGTEDVIGHNCRFLQGPKTLRDSPRRLKEATEKGDEICEALLNYRRDGRPFINLLMIAPLHDNKGNVKYNIGAQVDVSGLVENGRGLDFFARYLASQQLRGRETSTESDLRKQKQLTKLRELSEMFDLEESAVVQTHSRSSSMNRDDDSRSVGSLDRPKALRRLFVADSGSESDEDEDESPPANYKADAWKLAQEGPEGRPSGRLPGVYDTYMLIRPAPSLRIIFVSRKLRKLVKGVQAPFLSHVAGPARTLAGLKESFNAGVSVSAKISFSAEPSGKRDGVKVNSGYKHEDGQYGKACWISATPLLGSDDRPGVWMIVFVEKSKANSNKHSKVKQAEANAEAEVTQSPKGMKQAEKPDSKPEQKSDDIKQGKPSKLDLPIKPVRIASHGPPATEPQQKQQDGSSETEVQATNGDSRVDAESSVPIAALEEPRSPETSEVKASENSTVRSNPANDLKEADKASARSDRINSPTMASRLAEETSEPLSRQRSGQDYQSARKFFLNLEEQRKFTPPPDIPANMVVKTPRDEEGQRDDSLAHDGGSDDNNDTPVATRIHTRRSSGDKTNSEPQQHVIDPSLDADSKEEPNNTSADQDSGVNEYEDQPAERPENDEDEEWQTPTKPNNVPRTGLVMDYLSHPGSAGRRRVNAEEFGRALHAQGGEEGESWDEACLKSPYSVD